MSYIYITEQGSKISVEGGYCTVTSANEMKRLIPIETIEYVSLFGNINLTTPALQMFMKNNITVTLYSKTGAYFGRIMSNENVNILRQRKQFRLSGDTEFSLNIAKRIIDAKIHNQSVVLNRYCPENENADKVKEMLHQMKIAAKGIAECTDIDRLIGYEGAAARCYFTGLSLCVDDDFKFSGRSRRPPKDEFNSMLSLGYSMLMNEIYGVLEGKRLNVYAGFLHRDRERHPTLASDMMEEWRSVIVDSTVLSLINGHEVKKDGFTRTNNGVFLDDKTLKIFLKKYEGKLRTSTSYLAYTNERQSFRRALWTQASMLAKAVDNERFDIYEPIRIR
ncbi:MAG: CRISPR-associated endonuclease Cas1 [Firmicutes bacterium]|nr:CRISPR-associated endonuclease Cas1 [Bacillota bacterium]